MQPRVFIPCFAQVQLERGKLTVTCAIGLDPLAHAHDQRSDHAGSSQAAHFQWKHENRGFARLRMLPRDQLAAPDLVLHLAKCASSQCSRSAGLTGRGFTVCESAGKRIFRVLEDSIV